MSQATGGEADGQGQDPVLLALDAGMEPFAVVVRQHRHRRLHQDRPRIHLLGHQVGGAAGQGVQCLNLLSGLEAGTGLPLLPFYP